jgi:hypothetical protein
LLSLDIFGHDSPDVAYVARRHGPSAGIVLTDVARQGRSVIYHQQNVRNTLGRKDLLSADKDSQKNPNRPGVRATPLAYRNDHAMLV